jgi:hypothetical protein
LHLEAENLAGLTFHNHLEWPAAHLTVRGKLLTRRARIDGQSKALAAIRALYCLDDFHINPAAANLHAIPQEFNQIGKKRANHFGPSGDKL